MADRSHLLSRDVDLDTHIQDVLNLIEWEELTDNGVTPFPPFYERAKAKGWKTSTLPCDHDVMLDLPEEFTETLIEVASTDGS